MGVWPLGMVSLAKHQPESQSSRPVRGRAGGSGSGGERGWRSRDRGGGSGRCWRGVGSQAGNGKRLLRQGWLAGHLAGLPGSMGGECGGSPQPAPGSGQLKHRRGGVRLQSQGGALLHPASSPAVVATLAYPQSSPPGAAPAPVSASPLEVCYLEAECLSPGPCSGLKAQRLLPITAGLAAPQHRPGVPVVAGVPASQRQTAARNEPRQTPPRAHPFLPGGASGPQASLLPHTSGLWLGPDTICQRPC